ncbi:elicitin [Phytophthora sojae]|uniref:Elicitin n=2 Tax=Phytophthora sojae TaxID=67593 RepID=G5ABB1_PHYSP|nr:elicitin [Phytophthora sojae]ABB56027.1 elicitin-like protein SOL4B [Phytophthora sojae]EGZ07256.1 elicitin [Phytophthora sojae]|eukprot:XP_009536822.1 elicitin [Phytophthora sojae]
MQSVAIFLTAFLVVVTFVANAENCTVLEVYTALEPVASDANFAACQTDSNYSLLSFAAPTLNQSEAFCASSACQTRLNTTLSSGLLPDCQVAIGAHRLNLTNAVTIAARCPTSLMERAVSKEEDHDTIGHTADNVATVVGHSVPMDELGAALSTLGI